jgi:DNA (cytosine-5)-methyltransferase 1
VRRNESPTIADAIGDLQNPQPEADARRSVIFRSEVRSRRKWGLPASARPRVQPPNQERRSHTAATQQRFRVYQWLRANQISPRLISDFTKGGVDSEAVARLALGSVQFPAVAPDGVVLAESASGMITLLEGLKTRKHSQKALSWQSSAPTVVTLPDDYVHPSEPRTFTVREMARFQGFPDDFEFQGRVTTGAHRRRFEVPQYSQVGNAVSPFLGLAVGLMVAKVLALSTSERDL